MAEEQNRGMELVILSLNHDVSESMKEQDKCPSFDVSIYHGAEILDTVICPVNNDEPISIKIPEFGSIRSHFDYLEFRFISSTHRKHVSYLRLFMSKSIEEKKVRTLTSSKLNFDISFTWKGDGSVPKPEKSLSEYLGGAYPQLFSNSLISSNKESNDLPIFQPPINACENVIWCRESVIRPMGWQADNDIVTTTEDQQGVLILTNLRLIYIPNFLHINSLIQSIMGNDEEKSIDNLLTSFKEKNIVLDPKDVAIMDLNGDGVLSKQELQTFLIDNIIKQQSRGEIIQLPICNIANIKLPHRKAFRRKDSTLTSSFKHANQSDMTSTSKYFPAGLLEVNIPSYVTHTGSGSPYVNYVIEVSAPRSGLNESWKIEHRYSDFDSLRHNLITETAGSATLPPLPKKHIFSSIENTENRKDGLCAFLNDLLNIESARSKTLATFLQATEVLTDIESQQQEADEEEKMSMLSPARRTALALLADNTPNRVRREGDVKEMYIDSKTGIDLKFVVPTSSNLPSSTYLSAEAWCESVQNEIEWRVEEAEFYDAFVNTFDNSKVTHQNTLIEKEQTETDRNKQLDIIQNQSTAPEKEKKEEEGGELGKVTDFFNAFDDRMSNSGSDSQLHQSDTLDNSASTNQHTPCITQGEYHRMGVSEACGWRVVDNSEFDICSSYPAAFAIPQAVSDEVMVGSSNQRSRKRIPALTWLHPVNGAPLCRSSQPLAGYQGINQHQLKLDIKLLVALRETVPGSTLKIFDARPKLNANANALTGKGFEDVAGIPGASDITFLNIENIHTMRHSFALLVAACTSEQDNFYELLIASKWLTHLKMILRGGVIMALAMDSGSPSLVHCSDGWDRTSQLSALAQLLLDPYYRTVQGFNTLVEKDFCSFGHLFNCRTNANNKQYSPIFLQFLDVVWQIQRQFPHSFEFNESYLIAIADGFHSNWASTFVGNCEKERLSKPSIHSLWQLIQGKQYLNCQYKSCGEKVKFLQPKYTMQALECWSSLYLRYNLFVSNEE